MLMVLFKVLKRTSKIIVGILIKKIKYKYET